MTHAAFLSRGITEQKTQVLVWILRLCVQPVLCLLEVYLTFNFQGARVLTTDIPGVMRKGMLLKERIGKKSNWPQTAS